MSERLTMIRKLLCQSVIGPTADVVTRRDRMPCLSDDAIAVLKAAEALGIRMAREEVPDAVRTSHQGRPEDDRGHAARPCNRHTRRLGQLSGPRPALTGPLCRPQSSRQQLPDWSDRRGFFHEHCTAGASGALFALLSWPIQVERTTSAIARAEISIVSVKR